MKFNRKSVILSGIVSFVALVLEILLLIFGIAPIYRKNPRASSITTVVLVFIFISFCGLVNSITMLIKHRKEK